MRDAAIAAFVLLLALLSAAIVRRMIAIGTLDHPGARSSHTRPTPKGGGVGIVAAFVLGLAAFGFLADGARTVQAALAGLVAGATLLAAVSYMDDVRTWPPSVKLAAQIAAALLAIGCGMRFELLHLPWLGAVDIGWWGVPLTAIWIVFVTNAVNFIDGLNGLASGSVAIACLFVAGASWSQQGGLVQATGLALAAGIAGFLPYNFPQARIFMGDVGSQVCGYVIAVLGVLASRLDGPSPVLLVPMVLFGVLFDVVFTLARRLLAGDRLTEAHRSHLYQVANRAGMPAWRVTAIYWGMAAWGGACGVALQSASGPEAGLIAMSVTAPPLLWLGAVVTMARTMRVGRW